MTNICHIIREEQERRPKQNVMQASNSFTKILLLPPFVTKGETSNLPQLVLKINKDVYRNGESLPPPSHLFLFNPNVPV